MPRTKKLPPAEVLAQWERDAERDRAAIAIMEKRGCSFSDALLAVWDEGIPASALYEKAPI